MVGFNHGGLSFYRVGNDSTLLQQAIPDAARFKNDIRFHIAFDAKGERVILGGGNEILVWDTATNDVLKELRVPISTDVPVAISRRCLDTHWMRPAASTATRRDCA